MKYRLYSILPMLLVSAFGTLRAQPREDFLLADGQSTGYRIVLSPTASGTERFAAHELQKYLQRISGAEFPIASEDTREQRIRVGIAGIDFEEKPETIGFDGFVIKAEPGSIELAGVNARGTLFAVYAFLEELGCRWFAPNFNFFGLEGGEVVPKLEVLRAPYLHKRVTPSLRYRKKYVEEGRSHTVENLRQLIDWMPKVGLNVFNCPTDYQHRGSTVWDNWRSDLIPELEKRDILIEVGGHGYQNFLPVDVYFEEHPEWFGLWNGQRSKDHRVVFETGNSGAMAEFLSNIEKYLRSHPEIDIFDLWPPDSARWSQSPESRKLGDDSRRHALVVNEVAKMLRQKFPQVRVEFIAYQTYLLPPKDVQFEDNTLMDLSPIARSYKVPIWDSGDEANKPYVEALTEWFKRAVYRNDISIYTYYRKYAWRSLPVVIPRLIASEIKYYKSLGVNGIGSYSEPADWFTFELNHYVAARASWNTDLDMEKVLKDYGQTRFGPAWSPVLNYFQIIEETVPSVCKIPGTQVRSEQELDESLKKLEKASALLKQAQHLAIGYLNAPELVAKLEISLQYATNDVRIRRLAWDIAKSAGWSDRSIEMLPLLRERRDLYLSHQGKGIFLPPTSYTNYGFRELSNF